MWKKRGYKVLILVVIIVGVIGIVGWSQREKLFKRVQVPVEVLPLIPTLAPTPTPTPRPLTFEEMNQLYGPCARVKALMYHHVESLEVAEAENNVYLTVSPETFRAQMEELRQKGYVVVSARQISDFFDKGIALPNKAVLLTFDDGYDDVYTQAYLILKEYGYPAVVFLATGLMENPGYLGWGKIAEMAGGGISFGNHTWSHKAVGGSLEQIRQEVETAQGQLAERGLNELMVFAYPYGSTNGRARQVLMEEGFSWAVTTVPGSVWCSQKRLDLPRIRVGNAKLGSYGL